MACGTIDAVASHETIQDGIRQGLDQQDKFALEVNALQHALLNMRWAARKQRVFANMPFKWS